ncbi:MAG: IS110 family transposase, partial [Defluviitaleaceae bacterium]|nr:IS110 family transposase [Defluviitaleaceae bacterium]
NRTSMDAFTERYRKWCAKKGYNFSLTKAEDIYCHAACQYTTLPKCDTTKLLIQSAVKALLSVMKQRAVIRCEVIQLAKQLPEYDCVLAMYGVGEITGSQLIAELGDVRRFGNRGAIVAFAGIDPAVNSSGTYNRESNPTTKRGSPHLRKTLFQVVETYLKEISKRRACFRLP